MRGVTWGLLIILIALFVASVLLNAVIGHMANVDEIHKYVFWHCPYCLNAYKDEQSLRWHVLRSHQYRYIGE